MTPLLACRSLVVEAPSRGLFARGARPLLDGVDLSIDERDALAVVGASGAGKTTLVHALTLLRRPSSGIVEFRGSDVTRAPRGALTAFRRAVQIVFQDPSDQLDPRDTVERAVREPFVVHGDRARDTRDGALRLVEEVGLTAAHLARTPDALSGGERQRVAIARAIASGPSLLFADEATSALDTVSRRHILDLLLTLRASRGLALVCVTHDRAVVDAMAKRVVVLFAGRVVEEGPIERVVDAPSHPHARALFSRASLAEVAPRGAPREGGCAFASHCPEAHDRCRAETPALVEIARGHRVACHARSA